MKKTLSFIVLVTVAALMLTSCSIFFNEEKCIEKLKAAGLIEGTCYLTEEECAELTSIENAIITKYMKGDFTVEIVREYMLIQDGDQSMRCVFITFATEEQAIKYVELRLKRYAETENPNNYKFARHGCTVVMTNLEVAQKMIPLKFK